MTILSRVTGNNTEVEIKAKGLFQRTGPLLICLVCYVLAACSGEPAITELRGSTMGTSYSVQIAQPLPEQKMSFLQTEIENELVLLDKGIFSTYVLNSEISRFNRLKLKQAMRVSSQFIEVMNMATDVSQGSEGAFDTTIAPLVFLWGFGPGRDITALPDETEIRVLLNQRGMEAIIQGPGNTLVKLKPRQLDFSAIAKGYAVDRIAAILEKYSINDFLVEIGGEVLSKGRRSSSDEWRLAIEQPRQGQRKVADLVGFEGQRMAVAGSGTYRNFAEIGGQRYAHEIDPRTGHPAENSLLAVTVIHTSAAMADAWATAFMVLGEEQAFVIAEHQQLPLYMMADNNHVITSHYNNAFELYLRRPN